MLLDAVLAARQLTWLATEREKVAYCVEQRQLGADDLPALTFESADAARRGSSPTNCHLEWRRVARKSACCIW